MSAKDLTTAEGVLEWASCISPVPRRWQIPGETYVAGVPVGDDTETAAKIARAMRVLAKLESKEIQDYLEECSIMNASDDLPSAYWLESELRAAAEEE